MKSTHQDITIGTETNQSSTTPRVLSAFSGISNGVLITGATVANTLISWNGIQTARGIEGENNTAVKQDVKNTFSLSSSVGSAILIGEASVDYLVFAVSHWNNLSCSQRMLLITTGVVGLAGSAYSMSRFGVEYNTFAAGMSAAAGIFALKIGKNVLSLFKACEQQNEMSREEKELGSSLFVNSRK